LSDANSILQIKLEGKKSGWHEICSYQGEYYAHRVGNNGHKEGAHQCCEHLGRRLGAP
jgi:hypothetical protein